MNTNLLNIVKQIITENGEEVLNNAKRLKAFFNDLAQEVPKPLRLAFGRCIEEGAYTALKAAPDTSARAVCKAAFAQKLRDEDGLDAALSGEALDILEAALFGEAKRAAFCASCGKELEDGWKLCPQCGVAVGSTASPPQYQPPPDNAAPGAREKSIWDYFGTAMGSKYATFAGRARRKEFWYFNLVFTILYIICSIIDSAAALHFETLGWGILSSICWFGFLIPSLSVSARRLHDVGKSGWFILVPIYNIVLWCTEGNAGANSYGADPKLP